ncbi:MAG: EAL domain-containing protein [Cyanobacteria bacterium P01_G01_bin.54]
MKLAIGQSEAPTLLSPSKIDRSWSPVWPTDPGDRQHRIIHHLSHQALNGLSLPRLFRLAAESIAHVLPDTAVSIWEVLSDGCTFKEIANTTPAQGLRTLSTRTEPQLTLLLDAATPCRVTPEQNAELLVCCATDTQHSLHCPISGSQHILGLLNVYTSHPEPFQETDSLFLQSIAHILATAIERHRAAALLNVQTQTLEAVASGTNLQDVLKSLCLLLEAQSPGVLCSVLLVDAENNCLRAGAAPSVPPEFAQGVDGLMIGEGQGSCGTAACRGEPVFATDIATDPLWRAFRDFALSHNIYACWSMPFRAQSGEVLGTFALSHAVPCTPTAHHLQILKTATHLASIAVESHRNTHRLQHQALYDDLTGLPNRVFFIEQLTQRCQASGFKRFALLFLDVDHFKLVNDSLGHCIGDQLLQQFTTCLKPCLRSGDCFTRLSGDEFALLLPGIEDVQQAQSVARCIQQTLSHPLVLDAHEVFVSVSIGIVHVQKPGHQPAELLRDADTAMYYAKAQARGSMAIFSPQMHTQARERLQLEHQLRQALEEITQGKKAPFEVYYQPIVHLATGAIAGFEALLRWQHPQKGPIAPEQFIPIAEETGLIVALGEWILRQACAQWQAWQAGHLDASHPTHPLIMSVNVSSRQFMQSSFMPMIRQILAETGIVPHCLKLEMTETVLMEASPSVTQTFTALRELGIQLSLDDFGTGYSSLSYLHQFPIQTLKIDRAFVARLEQEQHSIVQSILGLAQGLHMEAIAEGIETPTQSQQLQHLGCEYGQGYYFSKAVPTAQATALLRQGLAIAPLAQLQTIH